MYFLFAKKIAQLSLLKEVKPSPAKRKVALIWLKALGHKLLLLSGTSGSKGVLKKPIIDEM